MNPRNKSLRIPFTFLLVLICTFFSPRGYAQNAAGTDQLLLEVTKQCQGMCDMSEVIYIRLYQSGHALTEIRWNKKPRTFEVSTEEKAQIIKLMETPDFLEAKTEYGPLRMYPDLAEYTKIKYRHNGQEKQITLINYDPRPEKVERCCPHSLMALMARITSIVETERNKPK